MRTRGIHIVGLAITVGLVMVIGATPADAAPPTAAATSITLQQAWNRPWANHLDTTYVLQEGDLVSSDSSTVYAGSLGNGFSIEAIDSATGATLSNSQATLTTSGWSVQLFPANRQVTSLVSISGGTPGAEPELLSTSNPNSGVTESSRRMNQVDASNEYEFGTIPGVYFGLGNARITPEMLYSANGIFPTSLRAYDFTSGNVLWETRVGSAPFSQFMYHPQRMYRPDHIATSSDGSRIYVVQTGSGFVYGVATRNGEILTRTALPPGHEIRNIVVSQIAPRAYVTDWTDNSILVLDTDSGQFISTLKIPGRCPESTSLDAAGDWLAIHVACDDPRILVMSTQDGRVAAAAPSSPNLTDVLLLPDSSGVITFRNGEIAGYSIKTTLPTPKGPKVIPAPLAPRGVSANTGAASAQISWKTPTNSSKAKITGYRVTAKPTGQTCLTKANKPTCTISGLVPGKKYQFAVEARNTKTWGLKALSPVVEIPRPAPAPTPEPEKPSAPLS